MMKFDGLVLETKKTVTKEKKTITKVRIETISYSDVSKFKTELPDIADVVFSDDAKVLKKAEFECPFFNTMNMSIDDKCVTVSKFVATKLNYKTNQDGDIILTFDLSFLTNENEDIDKFIGNVAELTL